MKCLQTQVDEIKQMVLMMTGQGEKEESRGVEKEESRGGENGESRGGENEENRGAKIEDVPEKAGQVMIGGTGGAVLLHVEPNNAEKEGTLAIVGRDAHIKRQSQTRSWFIERKFPGIWNVCIDTMEISIVLAAVMIRAVCGQLTKIPDNTAGLVGSSITLQCAGTVLQWEAFATSPQEAKTISVEARNYKSNMYDLITMPAGTYNLTIKSLVLANGGGFQCKAINDVQSFAIAQVIVFKDFKPTCNNNATNNKAVEGDYIGYNCEVKYRGNIDPLMKWKDGSSGAVVPANDESSMGTSKYSIVAQMTPSHNEQSFTCQTYFEKPQPGSLLTSAAYNIPINNNAYKELYTSPQLTVYYSPRSLKADVDSRLFSPGEEITINPGEKITITADSNPSSRTYKWMNATGTATGDSINVDMLVGQSLTVVVCNTIPIPAPHSACTEYSATVAVTGGALRAQKLTASSDVSQALVHNPSEPTQAATRDGTYLY
ncbi:hypothetical protein LSAT2_016349 [Lamellibrachia satsuma]|nr:hypothetical protein LSAT2_016349 [Lamellibrachia satsuma]